MRVTPTVRCIAKIFSVFVAAFSLAFISCAANDDSASLTIQMPGSSSSRAISSEGHLLGEEAELELNYSVYIRDSDNEEVEKYTNVAPGTKLTISALRAGNYKVAIRGIAWGSVMFYGAADAVVQGGVENTVGIQLEGVNQDDSKIRFTDPTAVHWDLVNAKITCKNGDFYNNISGSLSTDPDGAYFDLSSYFFEPNFDYTIEITVVNAMDSSTHHFKTSATATKNGIVFTVN
ncbi:MAG: hypothetical protein IKQ13_14860 [Treponema sp.]|nr:hypothetical protein [Treponema sp.]